MSVKEIEEAITRLDAGELAELATWFEEFEAKAWDERIERDSLAGRFDGLIQRAREQFEAGKCRPL